MSSIIIDTRERNVLRHAVELKDTPHTIKQITTGDYVIHNAGKIMIVIERKSLEDYAASFKDGRHDNKEKLLKLREETGCTIMYIIEGPAYPNPKSYFGNIAYANIESSIFHLMIRDGISCVFTKDTLGTAQLLARLVKSVDTLIAKTKKAVSFKAVHVPQTSPLQQTSLETSPEQVPQQASAVTNEITDEIIDEMVETVEAEIASGAGEVTFTSDELAARLTQRRDKTNIEIQRSIWSCLGGITSECADDYIGKIKIRDALAGKVHESNLSVVKLATGKPIGKRQVKSITRLQYDPATQRRMLACVPGISDKTAAELLKTVNLNALLNLSLLDLAEKKGASSKSKDEVGKPIGLVRAKKIQDCFV